MSKLNNLFENNRRWAAEVKKHDPEFFLKLSKQQSPNYLWIGCSDSRVPANQIVGLMPGEIFVHRNVGNVIVHTDFNCLSVVQFAVSVLKVKHIIVCGHYGCGGVLAALRNSNLGLIDNWLRHIRDIFRRHHDLLESVEEETRRLKMLCELNVIEQVNNVSSTTIVQEAWSVGEELSVHGWIYGIETGLIKDLGLTISSPGEALEQYRRAVLAVTTESATRESASCVL
jgi:carbonic anhydrase